MKKFQQRAIAARILNIEDNIVDRKFLEEILKTMKFDPSRKGPTAHRPTLDDKVIVLCPPNQQSNSAELAELVFI